MTGLWEWFKGPGQANAKPVLDDQCNEPAAPRRAKPRNAAAAVVHAEADWAKNGDRTDQANKRRLTHR